jgi:FlaA1/EpsC-like NDP-sugar epimerase
MVTGAAGSIGSEIVRQILAYSPGRIVLVDQSESQLYHMEQELSLNTDKITELEYVLADITNESRMRQVFDHFRPKVIYHAAAYKHVPLMEENPFEAVWTNIKGTQNLADLSIEFNVEAFVMVSTDKAVNPTNVMGCSKRICEIYVQSLNKTEAIDGKVKTKFITTRFGNVLGSSGSVIPLFKKQIENGGPITVTHPDVKRYFMTIPEACHLVLEAGAMGNGGEIYIFDMGESVRIVDLAQKMVQLSGLEVGRDIEIEFIGLRSGEKLYEELLASDENTLPTHHDKIMIAKVPFMSYYKISESLKTLIKLSKGNDDVALVGFMKSLVPEYKSHNSKYEKLDLPSATLQVS